LTHNRDAFDDVGVVEGKHELFFVVLGHSKVVLGENFDSVFGLTGSRVNLKNAEFAAGKLTRDLKRFGGSRTVVESDVENHKRDIEIWGLEKNN